MLIAIHMFRLVAGADVAAFLAADRAVQTEFIPNQPGFVRRTTARADDGGWVVIELWGSAEEADAAGALAADHPVVAAFDAFVEPGSSARRRYTTLDYL